MTGRSDSVTGESLSAEALLEPSYGQPHERLGLEHLALGVPDATGPPRSSRDGFPADLTERINARAEHFLVREGAGC